MLFDDRPWLLFLIPAGFLGLAVALAQNGNGLGAIGAFHNINASGALRAAPCGQAVKYQLGTIDQRFGMSGQDALVAIRQSVGLWNSAAKTAVIEYGGDTGIPVNFIYDDRERMAQDHAAYAATIREDEVEKKQIDSDAAALREKLNDARTALSAEESAFKGKQDTYNADVAKLNNGGGGNDEQIKTFDGYKLQLEQQLTQMKSEQTAINDLVDQENSLIAKHNALVERANAVITIVNQDVGKGFVAGLYTMSNGRAQIDIFAFADRPDLIRLLAHEFGHALGVGHIANPKSVMAASRETGTVSLDTAGEMDELDPDDISALRSVCDK